MILIFSYGTERINTRSEVYPYLFSETLWTRYINFVIAQMSYSGQDVYEKADFVRRKKHTEVTCGQSGGPSALFFIF